MLQVFLCKYRALYRLYTNNLTINPDMIMDILGFEHYSVNITSAKCSVLKNQYYLLILSCFDGIRIHTTGYIYRLSKRLIPRNWRGWRYTSKVWRFLDARRVSCVISSQTQARAQPEDRQGGRGGEAQVYSQVQGTQLHVLGSRAAFSYLYQRCSACARQIFGSLHSWQSSLPLIAEGVSYFFNK